VKGRDLEPHDFEPSAPAVAIINETMAHRFFEMTTRSATS